MKEDDVVITTLTQADGQVKRRPALILRVMPGLGDLLVCGFSTQLNQRTVSFDEIIFPSDADFASSGLSTVSPIRLGFLALRPSTGINGVIGAISTERHGRLLRRLSDCLSANLSPF